MKIKKRILFVEDSKYQSVINLLDKEGIKNWNEFGAFRFDLLTAIITAAAIITLGVIIL